MFVVFEAYNGLASLVSRWLATENKRVKSLANLWHPGPADTQEVLYKACWKLVGLFF